MIEILILASTMCPAGISAPCYEKMQIERHGQSFKILSSTVGTHCEIYGHSWEWKYAQWGPALHDHPIGMKCSVCGIDRTKKTIQHKREVADIEELWEDDGSKVETPPDRPTVMLDRFFQNQ